ncbi:MAG: NnrS family protein [Deltaproteobacteria bacterium]|nr:NnrS family protein [Deltaproteobacteria bacterium]
MVLRVPESERSFAAPVAPRWRAEPFRLFFPLAVLLGWVGIGHWLLYGVGVLATYSCLFHGLVQMQAFMMAFALGFLLTALPRRTRSDAPSAVEMSLALACLVAITGAAAAERWALAEVGYAALFLGLLRFAIRRFLGAGAGRRPPAAFVLIPIGVAHGLADAAPPADLDASARERMKALVRATVVALGLALGGGAWKRPAKPGFHRKLVWLSAWLMPLGLAVAGLWPDYRVPALHVLFIGGFGLMAFGVATHVALSHLGLDALAAGRPPAIVVLGVMLVLAMLARFAADLSHTYFDHLAWAAALWLTGSAVWLVFLAPKLLRSR